MKRFLPIVASLFMASAAQAQIAITAADMPVRGDVLTYSNVTAVGSGIDPTADSGANRTWDFSFLVSSGAGQDMYRSAADVSLNFASTISATAVGYKIADSIPGLGQLLAVVAPVPVNITDIHTFFDRFTSPRPAYVATAMSYRLSILPVASNYITPDVWYFFPLTFGNATDSTPFHVNMDLMSFATIEQVGTRKTRVDGWGTIVTPYFSTPQPCIRVRHEITETDSIDISGTKFGIPRNTVEYKWLVNGEHYPALWITSNVMGGTETPATIRYRDGVKPVTVSDASPAVAQLSVFPNPAVNGITKLQLPADFTTYQVEVFDITSKLVVSQGNNATIDLSKCAPGQYLVRVMSEGKTGYAKVVR